MKAVIAKVGRSALAAVERLESRIQLSAGKAVPLGTTAQLFNASNAVFIENLGQWGDANIKYAYSGQGIQIGFTDSGPVFELERAKKGVRAVLAKRPAPMGDLAAEIETVRLTMSFDGAKRVSPVGIGRSGARYNFLGGDAARQRSDVSGFGEIEYTDLYDGIDLMSSGKANGLKYEFHVAPGADYRQIRVTYSGAERLRVAADGSLHVETALGDVTEGAPVLYQMNRGIRTAVKGKFVLIDGDTYGFEISGKWDRSRKLVIDPDLEWATYLGGSSSDSINRATTDSAGNVYVAGGSTVGRWGTAGSYDPVGSAPNNAFVAEFTQSGSLVFATLLSGVGTSNSAYGIALDTANNIYITGPTAGKFATPGAYNSTIAGLIDAYVAKFNSTGSKLIYATYFGGTESDYGQAIAVDRAGNAYITGFTGSSGIATPGAFNETKSASTEAFVAGFDSTGSKLLFSTYLNGSNTAHGFSIAADPAGELYVGGDGSAGPFAVKLSSSGSALRYATYIGGNAFGACYGIAVDRFGSVYLAGATSATNLATDGVFDATPDGKEDGFAAKLDSSGKLLFATYLGGTSYDHCSQIALDGEGNIYLIGNTDSDGWATQDAYDPTYNGDGTKEDAFFAKLSPDASSLLYATYLGGAKVDVAFALAIDGFGNVYVAGETSSNDWATTGAYKTTFSSTSIDGFVVKFSNMAALYPGDTNGDKVCDFSDLVAVAQHYGSVGGMSRREGDLNGDGEVDFAELVLVAQNYLG